MRIPLPLKLAITFDRGRMGLPVSLLITGMGFSPLAPAVTDDLGVLGIGRDPAAMVFGAVTPPAIRLAADLLRKAEYRNWYRVLTASPPVEAVKTPPLGGGVLLHQRR